MEIEKRNLLTRDEVESVRKHLRNGIVPESLKPVGTVETNDGRKYFSRYLLGCTQDRFSITLEGPEGDEFLVLHAKSATLRQNYPADRIYPHGLRSVALHEDDLRVGFFGYLLNPYREMSDAIKFEMEQQPRFELGSFLSQFIEVKVDLRHLGRGVDLLALYPTFQQREVPAIEQFVVISHGDYRILPSALVFVPVPAHIAAQFR